MQHVKPDRKGAIGMLSEANVCEVRSDTTTFSVTRARLTAEVQPFAVAALRVQTDFAAIGRTTVDTVPSFTLADAYVQISPPESSSAAHPAVLARERC